MTSHKISNGESGLLEVCTVEKKGAVQTVEVCVELEHELRLGWPCKVRRDPQRQFTRAIAHDQNVKPGSHPPTANHLLGCAIPMTRRMKNQ